MVSSSDAYCLEIPVDGVVEALVRGGLDVPIGLADADDFGNLPAGMAREVSMPYSVRDVDTEQLTTCSWKYRTA